MVIWDGGNKSMSSVNRSAQSPQGRDIPQSLKLTDFLRPVFQENLMVREYSLLAQIQQHQTPNDGASSVSSSQETLYGGSGQPKLLTGVYVVPSAQSNYVWFGMICINNDRSGVPSPWHGGVFRFVMRFPEGYPTSGWPTVTFLPSSFTPPSTLTALTTHPDINPVGGSFNLRPYLSSAQNPSPVIPRTYKILRIVRKSFYRQFAETDLQASINSSAVELISRDYSEFLQQCSTEATGSTQYLREIDSYLISIFKNDPNLMLLSEREQPPTANNGISEQKPKRGRSLGLSFMQS